MLPGNALYFPRFHTTDRTEQHHGDTRGLCASPGGRPGGCAPPQEAALSHPSASGRAVGTERWPRAQPGLATRAGWAPGSAQGRLRCSPEVLRCSGASSTGQAWLRRLRAHCPSRDRAGGRFCSPPHAGSCHGNSLLGWGQIHLHPLSRPCLPMARGLRAAPPCHPIHPHPLHPARPLAGRLLPVGPCQPGASRIHPEAALPQAGEAEAPGRAVPGVRGTLPSALQRGGLKLCTGLPGRAPGCGPTEGHGSCSTTHSNTTRVWDGTWTNLRSGQCRRRQALGAGVGQGSPGLLLDRGLSRRGLLGGAGVVAPLGSRVRGAGLIGAPAGAAVLPRQLEEVRQHQVLLGEQPPLVVGPAALGTVQQLHQPWGKSRTRTSARHRHPPLKALA